MVRTGWTPAASPFSLIQEHLWPDEWAILVACLMLNCTRRKQVEAILPTFLQRWPRPNEFMNASDDDVMEHTRSLGFASRRTTMLKRMTAAYLSGEWSHARELPGVGEYAAAAWEIFCVGTLPDEPPKDHALVLYWRWAKQNQGMSETHARGT